MPGEPWRASWGRRLTFDDIAFSLDLEKEEGVADSDDLDTDLAVLLQVAGEAARARATTLVLFVDEMQYVEEHRLAALIRAMAESMPPRRHHLICPTIMSTACGLNISGSKCPPTHSFMCSWTSAFGSRRVSSIS